jgi:hypothetical protein
MKTNQRKKKEALFLSNGLVSTRTTEHPLCQKVLLEEPFFYQMASPTYQKLGQCQPKE